MYWEWSIGARKSDGPGFWSGADARAEGLQNRRLLFSKKSPSQLTIPKVEKNNLDYE